MCGGGGYEVTLRFSVSYFSALVAAKEGKAAAKALWPWRSLCTQKPKCTFAYLKVDNAQNLFQYTVSRPKKSSQECSEVQCDWGTSKAHVAQDRSPYLTFLETT